MGGGEAGCWPIHSAKTSSRSRTGPLSSGQESGQHQSSSLGSLGTTSPLFGSVRLSVCLSVLLRDTTESLTCLSLWGQKPLCSLRPLLVSHDRRLKTTFVLSDYKLNKQ